MCKFFCLSLSDLDRIITLVCLVNTEASSAIQRPDKWPVTALEKKALFLLQDVRKSFQENKLSPSQTPLEKQFPQGQDSSIIYTSREVIPYALSKLAPFPDL